MKAPRWFAWLLGIGLVVLGGLWLIARTRDADGNRVSATASTSSATPVAPDAHRLSTLLSTIPSPEMSAPRTDAARRIPTAECFAARTREGKRVRPTEVELETNAQQRDDEHARITGALESCEAKDGIEFETCMIAKGVDRGSVSSEEAVGHLQLQAALRAEALRISKRGDARSLVAAALVIPNADTRRAGESVAMRAPEAEAWLVEAQRLGRNDALVQWSVARIIASVGDGDSPALIEARAAARARLPMLEPDNAAAFLFSLDTEHTPRPPSSRADLTRAAAMSRYRVPMAEQVTLVLDALRAMPVYPGLREQALRMNPDHEAAAACASDADLLGEIRMVLAIAPVVEPTPDPAGLADICTEESTAGSTPTRDACLRLFELMQAGGSLIEQAQAAGMARRIAPAGAARAQWEERHRHYLWRQYRMMEASAAIDPYELSRIHEHAWRSGSEAFAIDELLTRAGVALEPPPDWQPPIGR